MKFFYFLTFAFFSFIEIKAQLTLTKTFNEPIVGDFYDTKTIDTTIALPINITGSGVVWNFTGITETPAINTNTYSSPANYAGSSTTYPGLTLVKEDLTTGDLNYFKVTPTTFELIGAFLNLGPATADLNYNTNSAIFYTYPISFGYSNSDLGAGTITTSTLSGTFTSTLQTAADGIGVLNLNSSVSLSNCLRVKIKQKIAFSFLGGLFAGTVDQYLYNYYHSSSKHPVFSISYNHIVSPGLPLFGIPAINTNQSKVEALSNIVLSVNEKKINNAIFKAYPNPATNEINIHFVLTQHESYDIEIINSLGQIVNARYLSNLNPGIYNEIINVSNLETGIYSIKLKGKNSSGFQKLIIE